MGITNLPDISKQKINDLSHIFELIRVYIHKKFILTKGYWVDHV